MHRTLRRHLMAALAAGLPLMISCGKTGGARDDGKIRVVATTAMIGDVVAVIGGDEVNVETLIGAGVDPHLYKATATDVKKLQAADVIFYNGLMLEGKMTGVLEKIGSNGKPVHAVTDRIRGDAGYLLDGDDDHVDPHVWMDVSGWMKAAEVIAEKLAVLRPERAAEILQRRDGYLDELRKLDAYSRKSLASIPESRRVLVTAHDAFGYMARAYGITVRGIQGISTESEAGLKDINSLVDFLVERNIPAVFVETSVPKKSVEALVEGARSRGRDVRIGGELFSDAMGAAGTYEGTYIGMIDHNVTLITRALGGEAPPQGMKGKLQ
ncbi:MAG: zinc ABC transporter substrate-binding protein [Verrucomicrobiota bacterium]